MEVRKDMNYTTDGYKWSILPLDKEIELSIQGIDPIYLNLTDLKEMIEALTEIKNE